MIPEGWGDGLEREGLCCEESHENDENRVKGGERASGALQGDYAVGHLDHSQYLSPTLE